MPALLKGCLKKGSEEGAARAQLVRQGNWDTMLPWEGGQGEFQGALQKGGAGEGLDLPGRSLARARVVVAVGGEAAESPLASWGP